GGLNSARTTIADGFFTMKRKLKRGAGAAVRAAAIVNASAAPARVKSIRARLGAVSQSLCKAPRIPLLVRLAADQREEFVAGLFVFAESAEHGAGNGLAVLLLYTAHLHA